MRFIFLKCLTKSVIFIKIKHHFNFNSFSTQIKKNIQLSIGGVHIKNKNIVSTLDILSFSRESLSSFYVKGLGYRYLFPNYDQDLIELAISHDAWIILK